MDKPAVGLFFIHLGNNKVEGKNKPIVTTTFGHILLFGLEVRFVALARLTILLDLR